MICRTLGCEIRNHKEHERHRYSSAAYEFEVPTRASRKLIGTSHSPHRGRRILGPLASCAALLDGHFRGVATRVSHVSFGTGTHARTLAGSHRRTQISYRAGPLGCANPRSCPSVGPSTSCRSRMICHAYIRSCSPLSFHRRV